MTVHQAKGLQFDVVVLPELDVGIGGQPPEIVAGCPKPAARIERVCRYVSKDLRAILPAEFQRMFAAHEERVVEESLCLLYVAMTRAVHSLHLVIAPSKDNEKTVPYTFAGVLRTALVGGKPVAPDTILYEHGEADWFVRVGPCEAAGSADGKRVSRAVDVSAAAAGAADTRAGSSQPVAIGRGRPGEPGPATALARGQSLDRGTLLHAWFEQISGWKTANRTTPRYGRSPAS